MKNLFLIGLVGLVAFTSCSKKDESNNDLSLLQGTKTTQTLYADQTSVASGAIKFSAVAPWTAFVKEIANKAIEGKIEWLTLSAYSGDKAGDYAIDITLQPNYTGESRMAEVKILCNSAEISIAVEQKGTTERGDKPGAPMLVSKITLMPGSIDASELTFDYHSNNRVKTIVMGQKGSSQSTTQTYTYSKNTISEITTSQSEVYETTYTLNSDGYIVSYVRNNEHGTFTYANGYLIQIDYTNADKDIYSWKDGCLASAQTQNFDGNMGTLYTYQYSSELNNCSANIDIVRMVAEGADFWALDYFGKRTKNLPVKQIGSMDKWGKDNGTHTYRYKKYENGLISQIYATYQEEGKAVEPEFLNYEIEYK